MIDRFMPVAVMLPALEVENILYTAENTITVSVIGGVWF